MPYLLAFCGWHSLCYKKAVAKLAIPLAAAIDENESKHMADKNELQISAEALAAAIETTGKFRAEEQGVVLGAILADVAPGDLKTAVGRIGNISAVSQALQKAGIIPASDSTPSAFMQAVKAALIASGATLPLKPS